jgi:outer membrane receptor protein involved in Fe transport
MERVEVLRGPQGTLFGRNSTAGAIQFISNKPSDVFYASLGGEYGSYNTRKGDAVLNVPLIDQVLDLRIAAHYQDNGPWMRNPSGLTPDGGQVLDNGLRVMALFHVSNNITDLLKVSVDHAWGHTYGEMHSAATGWPSVAANPTHDNILIGPTTNFYGTCNGCDPYGQPTLGFVDNVNVPPTLKKALSLTYSNELTAVVGNTTITSVTGYNSYHKDFTQDCDGTPLPICETHYKDAYSQFSQEVRAYIDGGDLRSTFGAYYLHARVQGVLAFGVYLNQTIIPGHTGLMVMGEDAQTSWGSAVFGNIEKDFGHQWTLTGGVRVAVDSKHINQDLGYYLDCPNDRGFAGFQTNDNPIVPYCGNIAFGTFNDQTAGGHNKFKSWTWTGKLEMDYKPNENTLVYASESHGAKAGAYNNQLPSIGLFPQTGGDNSLFYVKPESVYASELGLKESFLDGRIRLSTAVFYYDYRSYQNQGWLDKGAIIANYKASDYGAEMDFSVIPYPGWTVKLNAGYANANVYKLGNAYGDIGTHPVSIDPHWNGGAAVRYETEALGGGRLGLQADVHARSFFYGESSTFKDTIVPASVRANARIDYTSQNDKYVVGFYVNNLANSQDIATVFDLANLFGSRFAVPMLPRWFGAQLTYKFH